MPQYPADVRQKAHVEHAVRLVQHQVLYAGQAGIRRLEVIEQASRGGHQDVHSTPKGMLLGTHPDATVHGSAGDRRVHRQIVQVLQHLSRELACGCEHESPSGSARLVDQPMEDGQEEGGSLPASCHRTGQHIATA